MLERTKPSHRDRVSAPPLPDVDVFFCYNSKDKVAVSEIAKLLVKEGIGVFFAEWEILPGDPWPWRLDKQIRKNRPAAVFIGKSGISPGQRLELGSFVQRGCTIIPVILLDYPQRVPKLPFILEAVKYVDFRETDANPIKLLKRAIIRVRSDGKRANGKRPNRASADGKAK